MRIVLYANTDWYLYNYRLSLAKFLREDGHEIFLISPSGKYVRNLQSEGFRWYGIQISRKSMNPIIGLIDLFKTRKTFRQVSPDIILNFTSKCVVFGTLAGKSLGVQNIINSITGLGFIFIKKTFYMRMMQEIVKKLYRFSLKKTKVIFQNSEDKEYFIANNLSQPNNSYLILGSGVDTRKFSPPKEFSQQQVVVLTTRLLKDKGVYEFVAAAKKVKKQFPNAIFALVGDVDKGNPSTITLEEVKNWEQNGFIEWWGFQDDMPEIYHKASIVCIPSYREGLSRSLIEAMSSGLPIIATDVIGCRELVEDGKNGYLIPVKDSIALSNAIIKLFKNPELMRSMGKYGRKLVLKKFSQEIINSQIYKILN